MKEKVLVGYKLSVIIIEIMDSFPPTTVERVICNLILFKLAP